MNRFRRFIMILADGARADVFADLLQKGKLPSIAQYLPFFREGTTAFPSTTGPAYLPYLTGCYPGTCNVPGIRWFDKTLYAERHFSGKKHRSYVGAETFFITRDMRSEIRTLFDMIPNSFNIFNALSRGISRSHNPTWFSRIWYWYYAHLTDHWALIDKAAGEKILTALARELEFLFVVFPGIDEHSHLSSPFHPKTIERYQEIDQCVGKIAKKLKEKGIWEETGLFIVSDHGLSETGTHLGLNTLLEEIGIRPFYYPKVVFRYGCRAASMVSGNGMSHLYLKGEKGWAGRMPWEEIAGRRDRLVDRLLEKEAIDLVAGQRGDGAIVVKSRRGEAIIEKSEIPSTKFETNSKFKIQNSNSGPVSDFGIRYSNLAGSDPFGYPPLPSQMSDRESLDLTFNTDYPDALIQLLQIFRSQRTGDLILSATKGFDLRKRHEVPEHKSSHGSLHWEHMKVPIVTNVPLPDRPIRSVDLFPTVLDLLSQKIPGEIDGISLA